MRPRTCVCAGLIGLLAVLLGPSVAVAQFPGRTVPAKEKTGSELVTLDASAVADAIRAPGTTMVAVRFRIEPKWHIYWKNPGESGTPPEIRITGPEGLVAGPILWPRPVVFRNQWETTYGYADEATLLVPVRIDRALDRGARRADPGNPRANPEAIHRTNGDRARALPPGAGRPSPQRRAPRPGAGRSPAVKTGAGPGFRRPFGRRDAPRPGARAARRQPRSRGAADCRGARPRGATASQAAGGCCTG